MQGVDIERKSVALNLESELTTFSAMITSNYLDTRHLHN